MKQALYGFTDHPITELGDTPGKAAPLRAAKAVAYDGNKYVTVEVGGATTQIKLGYLYRTRGGRAFSHRRASALRLG